MKHLIDAAEASGQSGTEWLSSAVLSWRRVACISDFGLTLDKDWSVAQRQEIVALAEVANATLATRESISAEEIARWRLLDDLRIFPRGAKQLLTAPIIELGDAIIALVSGRLPEASTELQSALISSNTASNSALYSSSSNWSKTKQRILPSR